MLITSLHKAHKGRWKQFYQHSVSFTTLKQHLFSGCFKAYQLDYILGLMNSKIYLWTPTFHPTATTQDFVSYLWLRHLFFKYGFYDQIFSYCTASPTTSKLSKHYFLCPPLLLANLSTCGPLGLNGWCSLLCLTHSRYLSIRKQLLKRTRGFCWAQKVSPTTLL